MSEREIVSYVTHETLGFHPKTRLYKLDICLSKTSIYYLNAFAQLINIIKLVDLPTKCFYLLILCGPIKIP